MDTYGERLDGYSTESPPDMLHTFISAVAIATNLKVCVDLALFPGHPFLQHLITCSMCKYRGEGRGDLIACSYIR